MGEKFCTKLPKGTPLRQIWSNKSFGVYGSSVVLMLDDDEKKKYARIAMGKSMSSITPRPLPRCRDTAFVEDTKSQSVLRILDAIRPPLHQMCITSASVVNHR